MKEDDYKFIIGGLLEYMFETTDYWDFADSNKEFFDFANDWTNKLKSGLKAKPLPPKTPSTCPHEWANERMKLVDDFIEYCERNKK